MMSTATKFKTERHTAEELMRLPDNAHFELIEGVLYPMSPTGLEHGYTSNRLSYYVSAHVYANDLGECFAAETGFLLARDPDTVLAPDFAFVAKARLSAEFTSGFVPVAPDLVLETRSPGDTSRLVAAKVERWLVAGVHLVWELNPKTRLLTVYSANRSPLILGVGDSLTGETLLPGFLLPVHKLFRENKL